MTSLATQIARRADWYALLLQAPAQAANSGLQTLTRHMFTVLSVAPLIDITYAGVSWHENFEPYVRDSARHLGVSAEIGVPADRMLETIYARHFGNSFAPPFSRYWLECRKPVPFHDGDSRVWRRMAVAVNAVDVWTRDGERTMDVLFELGGPSGWSRAEFARAGLYRWAVYCTGILDRDDDREPPLPLLGFHYSVTPDGRCERLGSGLIPALRDTPGREGALARGALVADFIGPFAEAHRIINCKNVGLGPRQLRRGDAKAFAKVGRKPDDVRYHVLELRDKRGTIELGSGASGEARAAAALHSVRGHFATYTPERPLFGKHSGTYFVPAHLRGDPGQGRVVKDYRLAPQQVPPTQAPV